MARQGDNFFLGLKDLDLIPSNAKNHQGTSSQTLGI